MPPMTTTSPFLITGCGRSGTGWAAALFTALGYPCGHETVFRYDGVGAFNQPDSSWLAVPYAAQTRSEEHTSELQSLMRISYAVFCLKKKNQTILIITKHARIS